MGEGAQNSWPVPGDRKSERKSGRRAKGKVSLGRPRGDGELSMPQCGWVLLIYQNDS